jgi:hypothetical protein
MAGTDALLRSCVFDGTDRMDVAGVEVEEDRDMDDELDLEAIEFADDWLSWRCCCLCWRAARLSYEAFFVCEGARLGISGTGLVEVAGSFWPGAVK